MRYKAKLHKLVAIEHKIEHPNAQTGFASNDELSILHAGLSFMLEYFESLDDRIVSLFLRRKRDSVESIMHARGMVKTE